MLKAMLQLCLVVLLSLFIAACGGGSKSGKDQENPDPAVSSAIKDMLGEEWSVFQDQWGFSKGGVAVRLMTPLGNYFASVGQGDNIDKNVHFRGASTTKTFTAASIMLMYQQGLLDLEDTVDSLIPGTSRPYLPDTPEYNLPYKNLITIRHLLENRAGVFDMTNDRIPPDADAPFAGMYYLDYVMEIQGQKEHTFTIDELVGVTARYGRPYTVPGGKFHYSNIGFSMLGKIIERVSGMSYEEYVRTTFIEPLGLNNTSFPSLGTERDLPWPYAEGFTVYEGEAYETTEKNPSSGVASGNVITTPRDLSLWISLLLSGKAGVSPENAAMMMDVSATGEEHVWYGLGITYTEGLGFGHNGGGAGYLTMMRYDPADNVAAVSFASVVVAEDIYALLDFMVSTAKKARALAGYPPHIQ